MHRSQIDGNKIARRPSLDETDGAWSPESPSKGRLRLHTPANELTEFNL